ncbi:MAG: MATE family efflux transporter [Chitinophagaceae bacterium]
MNKNILKWNFIFQYGWVLTNIFNSILLLPLYLNHIDSNTLGVWLATGNILGWMTLVDPGVGEVLQQKIAELSGRKEYSEIGKSIGSGFIASFFILLIAVALGYACYFFIGAIINKDISQYPHLSMALVLSVIATGMSLVSFSMSGINQGLHNSAHVAIAALIANFLFLFVNLLFLYFEYGVLSIAIANLARALFLNVYNIASMLRLLEKRGIKILFEYVHFKRFIRIFSFTSTSKIISGLAYSVDMIVLARFISPAMITVYEINKRPLNVTFSLIGRHSVALMPLISHAKGMGDKSSIINLINTQFRFYSYATLYASFLFFFNYENLITAWTGKGQFAGNVILYLLIANFLCSLLFTFMSNVAYALGDIKTISLFNIIRNICFGIVMFFAARSFGIIGTLVVTLFMTVMADFFFYNYRVYKLGYLDMSLLRKSINPWIIIIPLSFLIGLGFQKLVENLMPANLYFSKLIINSGIFTLFFICLVLIVDREFGKIVKQAFNKYVFPLVSKFMPV